MVMEPEKLRRSEERWRGIIKELELENNRPTARNSSLHRPKRLTLPPYRVDASLSEPDAQEICWLRFSSFHLPSHKCLPPTRVDIKRQHPADC